MVTVGKRDGSRKRDGCGNSDCGEKKMKKKMSL